MIAAHLNRLDLSQGPTQSTGQSLKAYGLAEPFRDEHESADHDRLRRGLHSLLTMLGPPIADADCAGCGPQRGLDLNQGSAGAG